jgi:hypothetical protein
VNGVMTGVRNVLVLSRAVTKGRRVTVQSCRKEVHNLARMMCQKQVRILNRIKTYINSERLSADSLYFYYELYTHSCCSNWRRTGNPPE